MTLLPQWARRASWGGVLLAMMAAACSRSQTVPPISEAPQLRIPAPAPDRNRQVPVAPVDWDSQPWVPQQPPRDWQYIVIHHTATTSGSVESIHRTHRARRDAAGNRWRGIGYHFVIGNGHGMDDGQIEPTFRWRDQIAGAHAGDVTYNNQGIGICLIGNFEQAPPTGAQLEALTALVQTLSDEYGIPAANIKRHGDVKATACPGRYFPMQALTQVLTGEPATFDTVPAQP